VNRGELWTAAGGPHYTGTPRPVLIIQDDRFDATHSVTICPLPNRPHRDPLLRIPLEPNQDTGRHTGTNRRKSGAKLADSAKTPGQRSYPANVKLGSEISSGERQSI